jgi:hypothetical protein
MKDKEFDLTPAAHTAVSPHRPGRAGCLHAAPQDRSRWWDLFSFIVVVKNIARTGRKHFGLPEMSKKTISKGLFNLFY